MKIRQITTTIAGSLKLSPQPSLPLKQNHLHIWVFRCRQSRCHTGSAAANNANNHAFTHFLLYIIAQTASYDKKNFLAIGKSCGIIPLVIT
jgi:hypothetical protein